LLYCIRRIIYSAKKGAFIMELTWGELEEKCKSCHACPLGDTRTNLVFGCGDRNAKLMFVGEAPGESEDLSGIPFVGRAGKLFAHLSAHRPLREAALKF
jgi:DNA polymerase